MLRRGAHAKKGAYQLLIVLENDTRITVGRLGTFLFPAGYYVYTGSAMAGLEARVRRHFSKQKRFHWHIDYLLEHGHVIGYSIKESNAREECIVNRQTLSLPGASVPVVGFGSSDCGCVAHLVYFASRPCLRLEMINSTELLG